MAPGRQARAAAAGAAAVALALCLWLGASGALAQSGGAGQAQAEDTKMEADAALRREYAFPIDALPREGLGQIEGEVWLDTPQATVETLLDAVEAGDLSRAAYTLDLTPVAPQERGDRGPRLAQQLARLIRDDGSVDWARLPDRPDGLIEPPINQQGPMTGVPRRAITLDTLEVNGRDAPIMVMRVKPREGPPVWLFSASTVRNIPILAETRERSLLVRYVPYEWRESRVAGLELWQWGALLVIGLLSVAIGWAVSRIFKQILLRITEPRMYGLVRDTKGPVTLATALLIAWAAGNFLVNPTGAVGLALGNIAILGVIGAVTWMAARAADHMTSRFSHRFESRAAQEDDADARRLVTQLSIGRRVVVLLAILIGFGIALSYFDIFRTLGLSLLFSAGAVSIVFGIAANAVLRNFLAGLQIGLAQPLRVGDTVTLSGKYGYIEDIGSVFLTMKTWDSRRLIVPYNVLLEQAMENWSKKSAFVIRHVELTVDFGTDIDALRKVTEDSVAACEEADPSYPPKVMATGASSEGLVLWVLLGARTPAQAWDLEVKVRERLVREIHRRPAALPRERVETVDRTAADTLHDPSDEEKGVAASARGGPGNGASASAGGSSSGS
jgi:small-conductance mechanosensitive channel